MIIYDMSRFYVDIFINSSLMPLAYSVPMNIKRITSLSKTNIKTQTKEKFAFTLRYITGVK